MFEDTQPPQSNTPIDNQPSPAGKTASAISSPTEESTKPIGPDTKNLPSLQEKQSAPEDIFGKVSPVKEPAATTPVTTEQSTGAELNEPAIKSPPSIFNKKLSLTKNSDITGAPSKASQGPVIPPIIPRKLAKKNLILLIIIIIAVLALIASAAWWFFGRTSQSPPQQQTTNPAFLSLLDQVKQGQKTVPEQKTSSTAKNLEQPVADLEQPPGDESKSPVDADTDGDGLTDEEEITLGTSINNSDTDNDGLYDREEVKVYKTDPLKADTDNDGWSDGDEIRKNQDPLKPDPGPLAENFYTNPQFKIEFEYLDNMVLESARNNIIQFNDNINQIKFYVYLNNSQPADLFPDRSYIINEHADGSLFIQASQAHEDQTPLSTQFNTQVYNSHNGLTYVLRYVATKRAVDHQQKFEKILSSFKLLP